MMASYTVQHSCGHSEEHKLYGKHSERERKIAWLQSTDCHQCYAAAQQQQREQAADNARQQAESQGLPQLQGSDKQIAWALTIRERMLEDIADTRTLILGNVGKGPQEISDRALQVLDEMELQTSAAWWIDHRYDTAQMVVRAALSN